MAGFFSPHSYERKAPRLSTIPKCGECGLAKKCLSPKMKPTGKGRHKVLFVAEAPGEQEDRQGVQLIGDAGNLLRGTLKSIGVDLEDCWKTNAVICRPPENKIEPYMISCCRASLLNTIRDLKPRVIILLGGSALRSILTGENQKDTSAISKWAGLTIPSSTHRAWLCPTYHPSYILRMGKDECLMGIFRRHLEHAMSLEKEPLPPVSLSDLESKIEIITSPRLARKRMADLAKKKGIVAFDYEGTGLKPERAEQRIVSVSFCLNGEDTFACMITEKEHRALRRVVQSPLRKVAANIKYEERWTKAKLGCRVENWYWDTMLMAHVLTNHSHVTSVKFQAYSLLGISDYNSHIFPYLKSKHANLLNSIDQIGTRDLLVYNGLDSLIEYMIMERQKEIIGDTI
ncbi:MAG: hypothetical protein DRN14_00135 [Thermoplasmata archaeon]|nr:MAG: hypothetical protein DRN14_00135 [Thermoplasmata archaeon]